MTVTTATTPLDHFDTGNQDSSLGRQVQEDNDRPVAGEFCFGPAYNGTSFVISGHKLYYSKPKQPEHWPSLYYIEVGSSSFPLKTGVIHNGQVYCLSTSEIYYIQGTGPGVFLPIRMDAKTGAQSIRGAVSVKGRGIFHTGPDGIYLFSGNDTKISEATLDPIFRGDTVEGLPGMTSMSTSFLHQFRNHLYFGYASGSDTYPANILVMNLDTLKTDYYIYNDGSNVNVSAISTDATNNRLLLGDATGYVRVAEVPANTDDSGTAISWDVKSKDFTLQTRAHFPRWVKYDVDASSATSVTGELFLDGTSHQSHTITGNRATKRRLVGTGNGERAAVRISGSGPATIYAAEFE